MFFSVQFLYLLPSWQRTPLHPATHVQTPGDVHVPPFSHSGVQVDPTIGGLEVETTDANVIWVVFAVT